MEIEGPGIVEAVARLETMRSQLGAAEITASFITAGGDVEIEVTESGFAMYVNGQAVPLKP